MSFGFGVYLCVPLKSFLMFCILLKNAIRSLASCWSDVDSGSGFCLFWLVISVIVLYSFFLSVLFVLTRLCIKSCFLYLSIVTNLFHSLLNAFQCWSSLYLVHFLSLFFMIFLCFFRSLSYQGFLCLLVIVFVVARIIFSTLLSISLLN